MARIFITGSTDGLGLLAARELVKNNHEVWLHARNEKRARDVQDKLPETSGVFVADLSSIEATKQLAMDLNNAGKFDAIIHNAGVYSAPSETLFFINVLAPYILTSMVKTPDRLIYLSSGMHRGGSPLTKEEEIQSISYSDSKQQLTTFMKAVAKRFPEAYVNAVDPGWVPTKMGGTSASDDLQKGYETQVWLATSTDKEVLTTGGYYYHQAQQTPHNQVDDAYLQQQLLQICEKISGVRFSA